MDLGLKGKAALVLAASKGLGKASAEALANEGANVVIGARTQHELELAAREIREKSGRQVLAMPVDVTKPEELVAFLASEQAGYITGTTIQVDGGAVRSY